jgi:hypothetical protein
VLIADEFSSANLLWAGNMLTTNGVSRSRQLTGVVISRDADRAARPSRAGVKTRSVTTPCIRQAESPPPLGMASNVTVSD